MTREDNVHAFRLHLFRRARELGNLSAASRERGVTREGLYKKMKRLRRDC
jgi:transcriptional regulator of acetoin/glycerol metabolism